MTVRAGQAGMASAWPVSGPADTGIRTKGGRLMRPAYDIAGKMGTAGLLLYCLGIMSWKDVLAGGQWLMNIAMILVLPRIYRSLPADPLFRLALLFYLYLLVYAAVLLQQDPASGGWLAQGLVAFVRLGFLQALVVGFWWATLNAQGRLSWPVWALVAGYGCRLLLDWPNEDWSHGIPGKLGFGLYYTLFGAFSALVTTWLLVRLCGAAAPGRSLAGNLGVSLLAVIAFLGLVYSSSRGAVLAFVLALPFVLYGCWRLAGRPVAGWKTLAAGAAAVVALGLVVSGGPVAERDPGGTGELGRLAEQGFADYTPAKPTSIGTRLVIWREALRRWQDRPVFGHGPGSTEDLLDEVEREYPIHAVSNFHSTYLELLVRLGAVGALFFLAHLALCAASFGKGVRDGWYGREVATFLLAGGVLFAVTIVFKEGTLDPRGAAVATFFLGGYYAYAVARFPGNPSAPGEAGPPLRRRRGMAEDARGKPE